MREILNEMLQILFAVLGCIFAFTGDVQLGATFMVLFYVAGIYYRTGQRT